MKWGHGSCSTILLRPASPNRVRKHERCSDNQRLLCQNKDTQNLFSLLPLPPILETRRVDSCCNPPVQEAENTLVLRTASLFHYITGFTGLTYSEWPLQKRSSAQAIISDAYRQIAHNKNHTQFILRHNNKQVRRYYIAEYPIVYFF